jgi:phosphate starvation-inducible PhoH-like protein
LTSTDVVRHRLVGKIVDAYDRYDQTSAANSPPAAQRAGGNPRR